MSDKIIKFNFSENLDYQLKAINSVVNLFKGLPKKTDDVYPQNTYKSLIEYDPVKNPVFYNNKRLLQNLNEIQFENNLILDDEIILEEVTTKKDKNKEAKTFYLNNNFTVEMETGTGKTYVYLRTILELYKQYNLKKFIIVVPSVAIREGVKKSIEQLTEHFKGLYSNLDISKYTIIGNGDKLNFLRTNLVEGKELCIAILNKDLINKNTNKINSEDEYGKVLWEDIKKIHPIVIIDEPQTMDGEKDKASNTLMKIAELNPLATIRYSATHKNLYNQLYKLDSYDAFEKNLVKKIYVKTITTQIRKDFPYIHYVEFNKKEKTAKIEIFYHKNGEKIKPKTFLVNSGDSLEELSNLKQYHNMYIAEQPNKEKPLKINMPNDEILELNIGEFKREFEQNNNDINIQIELAIKNHFKTQFNLIEEGKEIKALALFFIDEVKKVRGENGTDGEYFLAFDRIYNKVINDEYYKTKLEKYKKYFPQYENVKNVREGYFAVDKNKNEVYSDNIKEEDKERAIELIIKGKDKLISFDEPLAFIFSHSALREGWDNPNVFTLCTLKKGGSDIAKKQEIGRGLRLPVDINGNRNTDDEFNRLTIIANESYEVFAEALQTDYNNEMGVNSEKVTRDILNLVLKKCDISKENITSGLIQELQNTFIANKVLSSKNQLTKDFDKKLNKIEFTNDLLQKHCNEIKQNFIEIMKDNDNKKAGNIQIRNVDDKEYTNEYSSFVSELEFKQILKILSGAFSKKTTYICDFDNEKFIQKCIDKINLFLENKKDNINKTILSQGKQQYSKTGRVSFDKTENDKTLDIEISEDIPKSDFEIANYVMKQTSLTRIAILYMLQNIYNRKSLNNQDILEEVCQLISKTFNDTKAENIIRYEVIDGYDIDNKKIFAMDTIDIKDIEADKVFKAKENSRALNKYYKIDSKGEKIFAKSLDNNPNIVLFTKLKKGGFVIDTPYGNYTPDWAIVYKENNKIKLYFIVETKFDKEEKNLQGVEKTKIDCAKLHFNAIGEIYKFDWVSGYDDFRNKFNVKDSI